MFSGVGTVGTLLVPALFWQYVAANSNVTGPGVPAQNYLLLTALDVFYYGGASNPAISIGSTGSSNTFFNWRPATSSEQSKQWSGLQVIDPTDNLFATIPDGTFDIRAAGFYWLSPV